MRYTTCYSPHYLFVLALCIVITPTVSIKAHENAPASSETKNHSLGWGATAIGLYTAEKTGRVIKRIAKNQSLRWVVKNPVRAGALATTLLIGFKRPPSFRATLGLIARASGSTLHASAKITRGMSFAQAKLGDSLQWSGKRLMQNSPSVLEQTREIRIPFRLSDGTIEEVVQSRDPIVTQQKPTLLHENIYSLYHLTA